MKISIVIPTLDEEESIGTLVSRLRRTAGEALHEILIADGGSRDRTAEYARRSGARVIDCAGKGRALQMNRGAAAASGDILYFLHADTLPPEDFDRSIRLAVHKGFNAGCFRLKFDDPNPVLRSYAWFTRFDIDLFRFGDQSLFVTRKLFERIGGFDESLLLMEDQEIVARLRKEGRFRLLGEAVVTSARRYRKNGILRLQLIFALILLGYHAGVRQETLVHLYRSLIAD